jgi:serine/threonine-protein kinase
MPDSAPSLTERAKRRVGAVLAEKWTIERLIGVGGTAAVYVGVHRNKKRAAIKVLHPELSVDPYLRARFLREGYVANTVGHPGAVRVDDDDVTEDGSVFLVMELLDGETVNSRWNRKSRRMNQAEVLWIGEQVLDVLDAAHAKGIVHRDIKPENLFITRDGVLKVLDFGIAQLREPNARATTTRSGMSMGTPAYMAPEQARGRWEEVDVRTDLWAVGAVLFALLTGRLVHEADTANEALAKAMSNPSRPIRELCPEVPESVAVVIDRALAYHKRHRFASAAEMAPRCATACAGCRCTPGAHHPGRGRVARRRPRVHGRGAARQSRPLARAQRLRLVGRRPGSDDRPRGARGAGALPPVRAERGRPRPPGGHRVEPPGR